MLLSTILYALFDLPRVSALWKGIPKSSFGDIAEILTHGKLHSRRKFTYRDREVHIEQWGKYHFMVFVWWEKSYAIFGNETLSLSQKLQIAKLLKARQKGTRLENILE